MPYEYKEGFQERTVVDNEEIGVLSVIHVADSSQQKSSHSILHSMKW